MTAYVKLDVRVNHCNLTPAQLAKTVAQFLRTAQLPEEDLMPLEISVEVDEHSGPCLSDCQQHEEV